MKEQINVKMHIDAAMELPSGDHVDEWMYSPFIETDEGFLKGRAIVTNIGIFPYLVDGEIENRLRLPEDVFDYQSRQTLQMVPLTDNHPSVPVDSDNIKDYQVGHLGTNLRDNGYGISADIVITDAAVIEKVKAGKVALSCGYFSDIEDVTGSKYGQPFDSKQTNIRYNHVAIVDAGRAGEDAVMFMDSADTQNFYCGMKKTVENEDEKPQEDDKVKPINDTKEKTMEHSKIIVDNKEIEVQSDAADKVLKIVEDRDQLALDKTALETKNTTLEAQKDAAEEKFEKEAKDKKALEDSIEGLVTAGVSARAEVLDAAAKAEVEVLETDTNLDIKKKVILSQADNKEVVTAKMDEKGEVYIDARFDGALEQLDDSNEAEEDKGEKVLGVDAASLKDQKEKKVLSVDEAKKVYEDSILNKNKK